MFPEAAAFKKDWQKRQSLLLESGADCSYLYVHLEADTGNPFYVGMGETKGRPWEKNRTSKHKNRANKHGNRVELISEPDMVWETALWWEVRWIKALKDFGYNLVNLTDGGDGVKGLKHTDKSKLLMSKKQLLAQNTEETRRRRAETNAKPEVILTKSAAQKEAQNRPEVVFAKSAAMSGDKSPMKRPEVKIKHKNNTPRGDKHHMKSEESRASCRGSNNIMARDDVKETHKNNVKRGDAHHTRLPGSAEKHKEVMRSPELTNKRIEATTAWWNSLSKEERDAVVKKSQEMRSKKLSERSPDDVHPNSKKVIHIGDNLTFLSIQKAAQHYGLKDVNISAVCNGRQKTTRGHRFRFVLED